MRGVVDLRRRCGPQGSRLGVSLLLRYCILPDERLEPAGLPPDFLRDFLRDRLADGTRFANILEERFLVMCFYLKCIFFYPVPKIRRRTFYCSFTVTLSCSLIDDLSGVGFEPTRPKPYHLE